MLASRVKLTCAAFRPTSSSLSFFFFSFFFLSRIGLIGWMRAAATSASSRLADRRICRVTELPDSATTDATRRNRAKETNRNSIHSVPSPRLDSIREHACAELRLCCFLPFRPSLTGRRRVSKPLRRALILLIRTMSFSSLIVERVYRRKLR